MIHSIVRPLVERYRDETGEWPTSWPQIVARYHPPLEFEYEMLCQNHPWRHIESGTLSNLALKGPMFEGGYPLYKLKLPRWMSWARMLVVDKATIVGWSRPIPSQSR